MSPDDQKKLAQIYIKKVWNKADMEIFEQITSEDFTYHLGGQPPRNKIEMRHFVDEVHQAFPDWEVEIQEIITENDVVTVRWAGEVTHQGVFHGIAPTGRKIAVSGINLYKIENDRIAREWEQMDSLGMIKQMGVIEK